MKRIELTMQFATPENFKRFGSLIGEANLPDPTFTDPAFNWYECIANINYNASDVKYGGLEIGFVQASPGENKQNQLERHTKTFEIIAPLSTNHLESAPGMGLVLAIGEADREEDFAAFILPHGTAAMLHPGIWHLAPKVKQGTAGALIIYAAGTGQNDKELITLANRGFEVNIQW